MTKQTPRNESTMQRRLNELHDMLVLAHDELNLLAPSLSNVHNAKRYIARAETALRQVNDLREEMPDLVRVPFRGIAR